ncbi:MAG TPA: alkaline phosphatase family protein, partial [Thermoanaerobaculia bacterium]|nr:alkaline phosphatase family protein [Thermoanaerobaculia bacterium]
MRNTNRLVRSTLTILALVLGLTASAAHAKDPKLVILGFDGADAELTKQWIAEGKLPNLAKLAQEGTFAPLRSTIPSQTPVSWSTFATGLNPGRHTIFDFLKRDVATYRPSFAMYDQKRVPFLWGSKNPLGVGSIAALALFLITFLLLKLFRLRTPVAATVAVVLAAAAGGGGAWAAKKYLPVDRPIAINRQQGETFWTTLGKAGKRVRVMRMPVTFPPKPYEHGELLTGLGTPDLSGRIGKPFFFTSELFFTPKGGGDFSIDVVELVDNKGTIETEIQGPPNELFPGDGRDYIKIPMKLTVAEDRSKLDIEVSGQKLSLKPGEWSDWARFVFPFNPLIKLHGIGKFRLVSLDPEVRLYLSPIQWDP